SFRPDAVLAVPVVHWSSGALPTGADRGGSAPRPGMLVPASPRSRATRSPDEHDRRRDRTAGAALRAPASGGGGAHHALVVLRAGRPARRVPAAGPEPELRPAGIGSARELRPAGFRPARRLRSAGQLRPA